MTNLLPVEDPRHLLPPDDTDPARTDAETAHVHRVAEYAQAWMAARETERTRPPEPPADPWDVVPPVPDWGAALFADPREMLHHLRSIRRQRGEPWNTEWPRFRGGGLYAPAKEGSPLLLAAALHTLHDHLRNRTAWEYPCYCTGGPGLWAYQDVPPFDRAACTCKGYERAWTQLDEAFAAVVRLAGWPDAFCVPREGSTLLENRGLDPARYDATREAYVTLAGQLTNPDLIRGRLSTQGSRRGGKKKKYLDPAPSDPEAMRDRWATRRKERPTELKGETDTAVGREFGVGPKQVQRARKGWTPE